MAIDWSIYHRTEKDRLQIGDKTFNVVVNPDNTVTLKEIIINPDTGSITPGSAEYTPAEFFNLGVVLRHDYLDDVRHLRLDVSELRKLDAVDSMRKFGDRITNDPTKFLTGSEDSDVIDSSFQDFFLNLRNDVGLFINNVSANVLNDYVGQASDDVNQIIENYKQKLLNEKCVIAGMEITAREYLDGKVLLPNLTKEQKQQLTDEQKQQLAEEQNQQLEDFINDVCKKFDAFRINVDRNARETRRRNSGVQFGNILYFSTYCKLLQEKIEELQFDYKNTDEQSIIENYRQKLLRKTDSFFGVKCTLQDLLNGKATLPYDAPVEQKRAFQEIIEKKEEEFNEQFEEFKSGFKYKRQLQHKFIIECMKDHREAIDKLNTLMTQLLEQNPKTIYEGTAPDRRDQKVRDFEVFFKSFTEAVRPYFDKFKELSSIKNEKIRPIIANRNDALNLLRGVLDQRIHELEALKNASGDKVKYLNDRRAYILGKNPALLTAEDQQFLDEYDSLKTNEMIKYRDLDLKVLHALHGLEDLSSIKADFVPDPDKKTLYYSIIDVDYVNHFLHASLDKTVVDDVKEVAKNPKAEKLKQRAEHANALYEQFLAQNEDAKREGDRIIDPRATAAKIARLGANPLVSGVQNSSFVQFVKGLIHRVKSCEPVQNNEFLWACRRSAQKRRDRKAERADLLRDIQNMGKKM